MLRNSPSIFGAAPSNATMSRFVARAAEQPETIDHGISTLMRRMRSRIWEAAGKRNPAALAIRLDPLILDIDATLTTSHSDKELATGNYKGGFGHAPMVISADYGKANGTGEVLAVHLRPGNRGANSVKSHIEVPANALAELPEDFYDEHGNLVGEKILVRADSAGSTREFLHHLHS